MTDRLIPIYAMFALLALSGCNNQPVRDPEFAATAPRPVAAPAPVNGAIFQAGYAKPLFEDLRARHVGDLLTVQLVEETVASKSAETKVDKDNTTTITNPTLLGAAMQFNLPPLVPLASRLDNTLQTTLVGDRAFDGAGESKQNNSITGSVTVTVSEVLVNGNLVVQGEKLITLNQGHEHVRFSGIVRPADIDSDNTVVSTKVANARIIYAGQGQIADAGVMGWMARFFSGPYFPF